MLRMDHFFAIRPGFAYETIHPACGKKNSSLVTVMCLKFNAFVGRDYVDMSSETKNMLVFVSGDASFKK